jgi:hypothetical protein
VSSDEAIMQKGNEAGFVKGYGAPQQSSMVGGSNRAGNNLPKNQKRILENAKQELRDVFGRA